MPPKRQIKLKSSGNSSLNSNKSSSTATSNKMRTTATARKTAGSSRGRAAPAPLRAAGGKGKAAGATAGTRKPAARPAARKPVTARKPMTSSIRKSRFTAPPPPPMYWICYDFAQKTIRGMCLGLAIGMVLTVVVPWLFDMGFLFAEKVQQSDLALPDLNKMGSDFTANLPSWNETTNKLWRSDQSRNGGSSSSYLRTATTKTFPLQPTMDPRVTADQNLIANFPRNNNRTMALIHVGHTGGQSLIQACPSLSCKQQFARDASQAQACVTEQVQRLYDNMPTNMSPLARQARHYFHLGMVDHSELQQSTTFLYTLRNPVDRILAIFHDAHPLSCTNAQAAGPPPRPHGCDTMNYWNMPDSQQFTFFSHCFPEVVPPEAFAQAVTSPWPDMKGEERIVETDEQQKHDCRWMAREAIAGTNADLTVLAPHMFYNYEHYTDQSLWKYPQQEILVLRAEHSQDDLTLLNSLLMLDTGKDPSQYPVLQPPTALITPIVTQEAYGKVCCVLEKEIEIYESILSRAANLPQYAKEKTMENLRKKCGLSADLAWAVWRMTCKEQMEMDFVLLAP